MDGDDNADDDDDDGGGDDEDEDGDGAFVWRGAFASQVQLPAVGKIGGPLCMTMCMDRHLFAMWHTMQCYTTCPL